MTFADEAAFQAAIIELAGYLGLKVYHTFDSRRSVAGFPDLVIVGEGGVLFRELKMPGKGPSPTQRDWLNALLRAGCDATCWWPADWPSLIRTELEYIKRRH